MKITVEGVDFDLPLLSDDERTVTLGQMVAHLVAAELVAQRMRDAPELAKMVTNVRREEIREQVRAQVANALTGPPGQASMTLAQAISNEARAQMEDGYQGTATPLKQVVAAEVYNVLHDEVLAIVTAAREQIREQVRQQIAVMVERGLGAIG